MVHALACEDINVQVTIIIKAINMDQPEQIGAPGEWGMDSWPLTWTNLCQQENLSFLSIRKSRKLQEFDRMVDDPGLDNYAKFGKIEKLARDWSWVVWWSVSPFVFLRMF